ncbi:MAG: DUF3179 domain-containing protein [Planctomycetes bacterium]|nr:DUF3179 domain-containing protein [Planctomycetota bacterium]
MSGGRPRIARGAFGWFVLFALLACLTTCDRAPSRNASPTAPASPSALDAAVAAPALPDETTFLAQIDRTRGVKDCFLPLRDPPFVPAADAIGVADGEMVLGLDLGTAQVCYPTLYLNWHEIVEHRMAGLELLACW